MRTLTTSLAIEDDVSILDIDIRFWILAILAENELAYEAIEMVLQFGSLVGAVDDPAVVSWIGVCLGAQLKTEVLDHVRRRTC